MAVTADRRRDDQAVMLERLGLDVVMFPLLQTSVTQGEELVELTRRTAQSPPDYLVANTGYGMRTWFDDARAAGLLDDLAAALRARTTIVARGAKALGELRRVGLDAAYRAPGEVLEEVVAHILREGVDSRSVLVQLHGEEAPDVLAPLQAAGADLRLLPVYRSRPAADGTGAALAQLVAGGELDAVSFTAAPQVGALRSAAVSSGRWEQVLARFNRGEVIAACIGSVCAAAAHEAGIELTLVPEHPRLGSLASALADRLLRPG